MRDDSTLQIELNAAHALVNWKHLFAMEVREQAKHLVADSDLISLTHYQQAAKIALGKLSEAIENGEANNGQRKVA